jgi:hypothetical protein
MPLSFGHVVGAGALLGIFADLAFNIYGGTNSSPQTTELFAEDRSETLWKYVRVGHGGAFAYGAAGSLLEGSWWPLIGSVSVIFFMHSLYAHALYAGQRASGQKGGMSRAQWGFQW